MEHEVSVIIWFTLHDADDGALPPYHGRNQRDGRAERNIEVEKGAAEYLMIRIVLWLGWLLGCIYTRATTAYLGKSNAMQWRSGRRAGVKRCWLSSHVSSYSKSRVL